MKRTGTWNSILLNIVIFLLMLHTSNVQASAPASVKETIKLLWLNCNHQDRSATVCEEVF